jgi:hypothetical protein
LKGWNGWASNVAQRVSLREGRRRRYREPRARHAGGRDWREDVHHALPDVKFGRGARFCQQIGVSTRVIEQDFVLADVRQNRRRVGQVAMERRRARIPGVGSADIEVSGMFERARGQRGVFPGSRCEAVRRSKRVRSMAISHKPRPVTASRSRTRLGPSWPS